MWARALGHAIVCIVLLLAPASATAQMRVFADIPWGASKETVAARLAAAKFPIYKTDNDGDYWFKGSMLGQQVQGFVIFRSGRAAKIVFSLLTPDSEAREIYTDLKRALTAKYGKPDSDFAFFNSPYYEGDGYEESAIKLGKGTFSAFWTSNTEQFGSMHVSIEKNLTVMVRYEAPDWGDEADRRRARDTDAL
jgi:hypothetical protein